jgi:tetratricopeptide (TPR) repeat protein
MPFRTLAISLVALGMAAASPAGAACVFGKVAELPVTMRGLRPTVTGKINGHDAVFMIDSGAFFSMMSEEAAARFGMKPTVAPFGMRVKGVGGGSAAVKVARAQVFEFAGAPFKNVDFLLGSRVGGEGEIVGLIGMNILASMDVEYDLANGYLRFFKAKDCGDANLAYWSAGKALSRVPIKPLTGSGAQIRTSARVDGRDITVNWDSGSALSVLSRPAAARVGARPNSENVTAAGVSYGLFGKGIETFIAPFGSFAIGDEEIKNTRLRIADIELGDADMLLGTDFFLSHRILVAKSQNKVYFTYNGGPVFRLERETRQQQAGTTVVSGPSAAAEGPKTAAEFSLRGAASMSRRDYAAAVADFSKAVELEPKAARHYKDRARARLAAGQAVLAMADLAEAVKLDPTDADTLLTRAVLYLGAKDEARAREDLEAAKKHGAGDPSLAAKIGQLYSAAGHYEAAVKEYDAWLAAHPNADRTPQVLNERCWTRGLWGRQLEAALADCDAALKRGGRNSSFMDSRGLVLLRMGRLDEAIAQYDAALKLQPKQAWSLYGRGLAKLRKGDKAGGEADIAAATALQPSLPEEVKRRGLASEPPAAGKT